MSASRRTIVVAGASRGIGLEVARRRAALGDEVIGASRSRSPHGRWVRADLTTAAGCRAVADAVGTRPLDALLYMGGTWETEAFTPQFDFERCSDADLRRVLGLNLLAPIRLAQRLLPALRRAPAPRIVLMGALSGLPHRATAEVANTASKSGLQGAAQALVEATRGQGIGVTVINPGNVATPEVLADLAEGRLHGGPAIPIDDLLACVDLVLGLSAAASVERIDIAAAAAQPQKPLPRSSSASGAKSSR